MIPACRPPAGIARVRRWVARAAVTLVFATATPAVGAAGPTPLPPVLTRDVTLRGAGTGWVPVRLTAPVTFAQSGQPQVLAVSDPAAFVGVLLVREQRGTWPPGVGVLSLPRDGGRPYANVFFGHERGTSADDDLPVVFRRRLLPGSYRLYLLASAPVTVTVRFPLRTGKQSFGARTRTAHHSTVALSPGVQGAAVTPVHSHSGTFALQRRGLLLDVAWWEGEATGYTDSGSCAYSGSVPDPGSAVPSCPDGPGASVGRAELRTPAKSMSTGYSYVPAARWLQKSYYSVAGALRRGGVAIYWVELGAGFPSA